MPTHARAHVQKPTNNPTQSRSGPGKRTVVVVVVVVAACFLVASGYNVRDDGVARDSSSSSSPSSPSSAAAAATTSVAFVGNSMWYFNDFPRFFEEMRDDDDDGGVVQNSCLHGGASIGSLLLEGNAMYPQFETGAAVLFLGDDDGHGNNTIYDYGACTVRQLLLGRDDRLVDDPGYPPMTSSSSNGANNIINNTNPCRSDLAYREYSIKKFNNVDNDDDKDDGLGGGGGGGGVPAGGWDYVLINDNTRNPARRTGRTNGLQMLEEYYVPWLLEVGSIPVFLWTHAYALGNNTCAGVDGGVDGGVVGGPYRSPTAAASPPTTTTDMTGLEDVAVFTSLTGVGYRAYVDLLGSYLPSSRAPRIAPVGLAFLVVYEEDRDLWTTLFHCDGLHASPSGSFLQGCVIYHALFGRMPDRRRVLREDMSYLWRRARMMQHAWEPPNPYPDRATAEYLYRVAERVMVEGHVPTSYIDYRNGEMVDH
ncbi:hypothetical protein ACHAW5_010680 [Stephanodiscus triporus]|uniref:Uncharacterized protein n=1 Tax=Stephanodiscus triporus TaxID=2934178 RepID=A0ABD3R0E0_9STRA